jgi:hypothetical protein
LTTSVTTGSGSYSTWTSSLASTPTSRLSVTTAATMSPANRTFSDAMNGRNMRSSMPMNGGGGLVPRLTSAAVNTWVPGSAAAAEPSMPRIRACAQGERTNVTCSVSGSRMSST